LQAEAIVRITSIVTTQECLESFTTVLLGLYEQVYWKYSTRRERARGFSPTVVEARFNVPGTVFVGLIALSAAE
jgi:hypothetical protein